MFPKYTDKIEILIHTRVSALTL